MIHLAREWKRHHASGDKPFLYYAKAKSYITIFDGRLPDAPVKERYEWPAAFAIEYCNEAPKSLDQIRSGLQARDETVDSSVETMGEILAHLVEKRVLYEEKGKYFTLALPVNPYL